MSAQPSAPSAPGASTPPQHPRHHRPGTIRVLPIPDPRPPVLPAERLRERIRSAGAPDTSRNYVQVALRIPFTTYGPDVDQDPVFSRQPTASAVLPDPQAWARLMITAILETMDGRRPVTQLTKSLTPEIRERIGRRGIAARRRGSLQRHAPTIRAISTCLPADGVAEISAVIEHAGAVRAAALRLSGLDGRWVVTALELG